MDLTTWEDRNLGEFDLSILKCGLFIIKKFHCQAILNDRNYKKPIDMEFYTHHLNPEWLYSSISISTKATISDRSCRSSLKYRDKIGSKV